MPQVQDQSLNLLTCSLSFTEVFEHKRCIQVKSTLLETNLEQPVIWKDVVIVISVLKIISLYFPTLHNTCQSPNKFGDLPWKKGVGISQQIKRV